VAPRENKQKTASPKTIQVALASNQKKNVESEGLKKEQGSKIGKVGTEKNVYTFALKVAKRNNKYLRQYWSPSWWKILSGKKTQKAFVQKTPFNRLN